MKLFIKKINDYIEEQFFERTRDLCSGKGGHITKSKFKVAIENLQEELQNKIKTLAEEDEILSSINCYYIKGYNIKTAETASNIVNKLIDSSETASSAKDPDIPYIKSVQQIPNKQGSNIYKVTLQPKSKISFQDDNKTLSCGQQMMKNLKFSHKIRQEYGSFHVEREIPTFLKKDHNILIKQQRIFRLIDEHKQTTEYNQPTKPIKTKIFIAENHQMTLAVETKTNEDGSIEWTNYTVKDLYPPTPPETEIKSSSSSSSSSSSTKSDLVPRSTIRKFKYPCPA